MDAHVNEWLKHHPLQAMYRVTLALDSPAFHIRSRLRDNGDGTFSFRREYPFGAKKC